MAVQLSKLAIDRLKKPATRIEIADASKPGLYLIVQPSGKKSWAVRYRVNGQSRKLTLNGFPELKTARKLAQSVIDAVAEGRDPAREKTSDRNAASNRIEDVLADFMARHVRRRDGRPIRESTKRETARLFGLALDPSGHWAPRRPKSGVLKRWSGRDVRSITRRDVLDLLDWRIESGACVGANRTLAALKTFVSWCIKRDILTASPCDRVDDPAPERAVDRALAGEEITALWRACGTVGFPYGSMVRFLLLTGQRRDEVREAVRAEIDPARGTWALPAERTKNGREHHVPLADVATDVLEAMPRIKSDAGFLFTVDGSVAISNLSRRKRALDKAMIAELRKIDTEAELKPWRLHDLRHTLKTWMQQARIPEDVRSAVQNHFNGGMDELYGHYSFEKEKRDALSAWARHIESLLAPAQSNVIELRG